MDLPATGEGPLARKKLEKATPILQNVLRSIFVEPCKTQRIGRHIADAAETSGKGINKTVLFERLTDECANAVSFAPVKSGCS